MTWLLDTNIISDLVKYPTGKAAEHIRTLDVRKIHTSVIVVGELRYGVTQKGRTRLTERINAILPLDARCADMYGKIRTTLEGEGLPIGSNDLWIAAHALAVDMILVTRNVQEFCRIQSLKVENWLD